MLEKIDLSKTMDKKEYKKRMEVLEPKAAERIKKLQCSGHDCIRGIWRCRKGNTD